MQRVDCVNSFIDVGANLGFLQREKINYHELKGPILLLYMRVGVIMMVSLEPKKMKTYSNIKATS